MVTLTPTRHGSPDTRRRTRPAARLGSAVGRLTALALVALALALTAAPAVGQTTTAATTTATTSTTAKAPAKPAKGVPADPNEKLPIPEGSDNPVAMSGGAGGTLIRLVLGLGLVVGLIGAVWYVMKRVQRSRYPAMDDRNTAGLIDVMATTSLGPNRFLHLVKVGRRSSSSAPPTTRSRRSRGSARRTRRASPAPAGRSRRPSGGTRGRRPAPGAEVGGRRLGRGPPARDDCPPLMRRLHPLPAAEVPTRLPTLRERIVAAMPPPARTRRRRWLRRVFLLSPVLMALLCVVSPAIAAAARPAST